MYYGLIRKMDVSNGPGIRISLFVSGCSRHCYNCFNTEAQSFINGKEYTKETESKILSLLKQSHVRGLSLLGGDPLEQLSDDMKNWLIPLVDSVYNLNKDIWLWTGFKWEEIFNRESKRGKCYTVKEAIEEVKWDFRKLLISKCNVLIDGPYIDSKKDITLPYCGSSNQRVIDIQSTLEHYNEDKVIDLWRV